MIIYLITNIIDGKQYVGQTIQTLRSRIKNHRHSARKGSHYHIHRAIRKFGEESFKFEILEEIFDASLLDEREIYWVAHFDTFANGYNMTTGGESRKKLSEESLLKIKQARSKQVITKEQSQKQSETMKKMYKSGELIAHSPIGLYWWNNDIISLRSKECPSPEFKRGRLTFKRRRRV